MGKKILLVAILIDVIMFGWLAYSWGNGHTAIMKLVELMR
jgi:hypothetical protein